MRLFALRPYHPSCPARLPAPYRSAKTDRLPAGWTRDAALLRVVNVGGLDEPMLAWNLALSIHDRGMRREALGTAFAAMVESDPAGGGTLLHQARLPEAELRRAERRRRVLPALAIFHHWLRQRRVRSTVPTKRAAVIRVAPAVTPPARAPERPCF